MKWFADIEYKRDNFELCCRIDNREGHGVIALVGPNGSGKSTLMQILAGAIKAQRIHYKIGEGTLADSSNNLHLRPQERRLGYLPQGNALFPHLNGLQNTCFGLSTGPYKLSASLRESKAASLLSKLEAAHLAPHKPSSMSGGEQQRIALARALVIEPRMLLLDEALASLDAVSRRQVRKLLTPELVGAPILMVTHDLRDLIALDCYIYVLEEGRIVQQGKLAELQQEPATAFVQELLLPFTWSENLSSPRSRAPDALGLPAAETTAPLKS